MEKSVDGLDRPSDSRLFISISVNLGWHTTRFISIKLCSDSPYCDWYCKSPSMTSFVVQITGFE